MTRTPHHPATGPGQKAVAFLVMLGCSALFLAMVVWPVAAPHMTLDFAPPQSVGTAFDSSLSTLDNALDELLDRVR